MYEKQPDFKKTMDYKQANIEKSQRSTQDSIRVSGSATDATLIVAALIPYWVQYNESITDDRLKKEWEKWRKFMFEQRDINETFKNLTVPFN